PTSIAKAIHQRKVQWQFINNSREPLALARQGLYRRQDFSSLLNFCPVYNSSAKISIQKQLLNGTSQSYLKQPTLTSTSTTTLTLTRLTINFFATLYHFNLPPHSHPHPQPTSNIQDAYPQSRSHSHRRGRRRSQSRLQPTHDRRPSICNHRARLPRCDQPARPSSWNAASEGHAAPFRETSGDVQGVDGDKPSMFCLHGSTSTCCSSSSSSKKEDHHQVDR
ncbi:hypothetical protein BKA61DRAFT_712952, partial [Leptodontidium sp. MPI-SDFR-AT-0119]